MTIPSTSREKHYLQEVNTYIVLVLIAESNTIHKLGRSSYKNMTNEKPSGQVHYNICKHRNFASFYFHKIRNFDIFAYFYVRVFR